MDRMKWWREAKFGMFIHWGIYSVAGRGEWVMFQEDIPVKEYDKLADKFKAERYNPEEWVKLAKKAGMKYMVLTTRHHDGFSLFDTKSSEFNSVKRGPKRDLVAEYVKACRKYNMKIGFYYSLVDWRWKVVYQGPEKNPEGWKKLVKYVHSQVKELMTNYGKIDILWFDGNFYVNKRRTVHTQPQDWDAKNLIKMVRKLQPEIIINNRTGLPEDFDTPEQHIRASESGRMWEACMTMNKHWGYFASDDLWKSTKQLIHNLTACASKGGNYLLNVGPKPDGTIPEESVERLLEIGKWLKKNGEAIYGTEAGKIDGGTAGVITRKGNKIFIIVHWWNPETLTLPYFREKIRSGYLLSNGKRLKIKKDGVRLKISGLPEKPPDPLSTVIVLNKK